MIAFHHRLFFIPAIGNTCFQSVGKIHAPNIWQLFKEQEKC